MSEVRALRASSEFRAALEPRPRGRVGRVVVAALDLWCATTGGAFELTRAGDVVVRRRTDGLEVVRIPVRVADGAPGLLAQVRADLATTTPAGFRRRWSA